VAGLQGGWAIFILFWHALHSVLYPLLLCQWIFPATAGRRWFATGRARWLLYLLLTGLAGLCALYFLNPVRNGLDLFLVYAAASLGLAGIALVFCKEQTALRSTVPANHSLKPALWGGCALLFYVLQFWSPRHIPFSLYLAASAAIIVFAAVQMARAAWRPLPDLLLFGLGDYLSFALFSSLLCVASARNPGQAVAAGALFTVLFLYLIAAVRRAPLGRGTVSRPASTAP
jgi:hypothetical protein